MSYTESVKIGTLVPGSQNTHKYIEQILPLGFETFSITFWQSCEDIDLKKLAADVKSVLKGTGASISTLGMFGNPLETRPKDLETVKGWERCIDAAEDFGCDIVDGFAGRVLDKKIDESLGRFVEIFKPLADRAKAKGVRLAFENCEMGGTWAQGDWNMAHTPDAWELMFNAIPNDNIGLEWEPCHQLYSLIDPLPQLRKWVNKVFHIHGKDATIHWDVLKTHGLRGNQTWVHHRTPGFGDTNWNDLITILRLGGFTGAIDIEGWHDPVYRGDLEMTGQVRALNYLKDCRGGPKFIPNPVMP